MALKSILHTILFLFAETDLIKTFYFNFKVFPFNVARKFPVLLARRVELIGIHRNCVELVNVKSGGVKIGYLNYPMKSGKGIHSLIRFGSKKARLKLKGEDIKIYRGCSIILACPESRIEIGKNVLFNQNVMLYASTLVKIGDNCRIGWDSQIYDSNFHFTYDKDRNSVANRKKQVILFNNVWVANRCTIAPGTILPPFSIVAANSLVNKDFSSILTQGNYFAGTPAKLKRSGLFRILSLKTESFLNKFFLNNQSTNIYGMFYKLTC